MPIAFDKQRFPLILAGLGRIALELLVFYASDGDISLVMAVPSTCYALTTLLHHIYRPHIRTIRPRHREYERGLRALLHDADTNQRVLGRNGALSMGLLVASGLGAALARMRVRDLRPVGL